MDIEAMLVTMKEQLELWDGEGAIDIGDVLLEELGKEQRQMQQNEHTIDCPDYEKALRISLLVKRANDMVKKAINKGSEPDFQEAVRELEEAIRIWRSGKPDVRLT